MKRKLITLLLVLVLVMTTTATVFAKGGKIRSTESAGTVNQAEYQPKKANKYKYDHKLQNPFPTAQPTLTATPSPSPSPEPYPYPEP